MELVYYDLFIRKMYYEDLFDVRFKNDFSIQLLKLIGYKEAMLLRMLYILTWAVVVCVCL